MPYSQTRPLPQRWLVTMPTVEQNLRLWKEEHDWPLSSWGGAQAQWYGCILPHISPFMPAAHILEIAPGHGRWTQFLQPELAGKIARDDGRAVIAAAASKGGADQARGDLPKIAALEHEPFEPIVIQHPVDTVGRQHQQLSSVKGFFDDMYLGARPRADHVRQRIAHRMLKQGP